MAPGLLSTLEERGAGGVKPWDGRMFFFEKKNQKTFIRFGRDFGLTAGANE
jgi:hypothetical protein